MRESLFQPVLGSCFVTGTGTDVGKTVVAAALADRLQADYWKPVQSGLADLPNGDSGSVADLVGLDRSRIIPPLYALQAPLSPDQAAQHDGVEIDMGRFTLPAANTPSGGNRPLVVEGAGGVLVPLTRRHTMVHVMARLLLPSVVVASSGLGTINHTLLTLEALRSRNLPVAGVILNGPPQPENAAAITRFGGVPILGILPPLNPLTPEALRAAAALWDLSPLTTPPPPPASGAPDEWEL